MKTNSLKLLCVSLLFIFTSNCLFAGWGGDRRKGCSIYKRFRADAHTTIYNILGQQIGGCIDEDKGCDWAAAECTYYNGAILDAYATARSDWDGVVGYSWSNNSLVVAGNYFFNTTNDAVMGYSEARGNAKIDITDGGKGGSGIISIKDIEANLSVAENSKFGSVFRIIIWASTENTDKEEMTSEKIVWEASARIENGKLILTGGFNQNDFSIDYSDKTISSSAENQQVIRVMNVRPTQRLRSGSGIELDINTDIKQLLLKNNFRKIPLQVINGLNASNIVVTIEGDSGYGTFIDKYSSQNNTTTSVNEQLSNEIIFTNFPQPFSDKTSIEFLLPETQHVYIEVYNDEGKLIKILFDNVAEREKKYKVDFNADNLPAGLYICRLRSQSQNLIKKLIIAH